MTEAPFSYSRTPVTLAIERRCRFGRFANRGASVKASSRRDNSLAETRAPGGIGVNGHPRTAGSMWILLRPRRSLCVRDRLRRNPISLDRPSRHGESRGPGNDPADPLLGLMRNSTDLALARRLLLMRDACGLTLPQIGWAP